MLERNKMLRPRVYSKTDKKVLEVIEIDFDYKVIVVRGIDNSNNNIEKFFRRTRYRSFVLYSK